jgi:hypothetical protein
MSEEAKDVLLIFVMLVVLSGLVLLPVQCAKSYDRQLVGVVKTISYSHNDGVKQVCEPRGRTSDCVGVENEPITSVEFEDGRKVQFVGLPYEPIPVGMRVRIYYNGWFRIVEIDQLPVERDHSR